MMKTGLTFIALLIMSACIYSQESSADKIDIRALLDKQIIEIKERQNKEKQNIDVSAANVAEAGQNKIEQNNKTLIANAEELINKDTATKIFIVAEFIMISGLIFLWATKNNREKKRKIAVLKNNIKKLREEKIGSYGKNNLSMLREKLRFDPIKINDNGKDITFRAKKNKIGKGEIHLAAKIKLLIGEYK